jgi:hypothetical protein
MSTKTMTSRLALAAVTGAVWMLVGVSVAHAEYTGPVKQIISSYSGREVNLTEVEKHAGAPLEDVCSVASADTCQRGGASSLAGGFIYPSGVAVDNDEASPQYGDVYVIDSTHRIQVLAADGSFVSTFGWDVNKTKVEKGGASQQAMNLCTETEIQAGGECQAGVDGEAPGQFGETQSGIAVDPASGDVYVADAVKTSVGEHPTNGERVQVFSSEGVWLAEIGKEVNETKDAMPGASAEEKDLCTEVEVTAKSVTCGGPTQYEFGKEPSTNDTEPGVFPIEIPSMSITAGGPEDLLYVGAGSRVQELDATDGKWKGEISLTSISSAPGSVVTALAVDDSCSLHEPTLTESTTPTCGEFDPEDGDVYLVYRAEIAGTSDNDHVIRKFTPAGVEIKSGGFPLAPSPREPAAAVAARGITLDVRGIAVDSADRLAVSESEASNVTKPYGSLYDGGTGRLITEFDNSFYAGYINHSSGSPEMSPSVGVAFGPKDKLYAAAQTNMAVVAYEPVPVAELLSSPAVCGAGEDHESDVTFDCALNGVVNPEGVSGTDVWFQWGKNPQLGLETPEQQVSTGSTLEPVAHAPVLEGLRPNATYYYRLAGYDENNQAPESPLSSETGSFTTGYVAPKVVGEPSTPFVRSSSVVFSAELNPENANTEYFFEYAAEAKPGENPLASCAGVRRASCPGVASTGVLESAAYENIGAFLEATGLATGTVYHYRLAAESENAGKTEKLTSKGPEGSFTTTAAPVPQAATGAPSAIGTSGATISGAVNSDGQPATYAFELGVYRGTGTQYGVVFSGPVGASVVPVQESLALTGLQPGTTYAYRVEVSSGYGTAYGEAVTFTTAGLPEVLLVPAPLEQLPIPAIAFPTPVTTPKLDVAPKKATKKKPKKAAKKRKGKKAKKARKGAAKKAK